MTDLFEAVNVMAERMLGIDDGGTFSGMTCFEAESVAAVFAAAGRMVAAGHVIMMHGDGDPEESDRHHDVHTALNRPGAGFSHDEADEPFRLAMDHVRELV